MPSCSRIQGEGEREGERETETQTGRDAETEPTGDRTEKGEGQRALSTKPSQLALPGEQGLLQLAGTWGLGWERSPPKRSGPASSCGTQVRSFLGAATLTCAALPLRGPSRLSLHLGASWLTVPDATGPLLPGVQPPFPWFSLHPSFITAPEGFEAGGVWRKPEAASLRVGVSRSRPVQTTDLCPVCLRWSDGSRVTAEPGPG